jgi:hypothetical protein
MVRPDSNTATLSFTSKHPHFYAEKHTTRNTTKRDVLPSVSPGADGIYLRSLAQRNPHSIVNPVAGALWRRHVGPATHRRYRQRYRNSSPALNGSLRSAPENARLLCFKSLRGSVHQHNFASAIPPLIPSGAFEYAPTYCLSAALDDNTNASKLPREYHQPTAHLATHPRCRGPIGPRD